MHFRASRRIFIFSVLCLFPMRAHSESYIAFYAGPSTSYRQDLKYKVYNAQGNIIAKDTVGSDTFLRGVVGVKLSYFLSPRFGIETEYSYGRTLAGIESTDNGQIDARLNQDRQSFMMAFLFRQVPRQKRLTPYGGVGAGAVYSEFEKIGHGWGYGGKMFVGMNYPISSKYALFSEFNFSWAPDVVDSSMAPDIRHYKTSGHASWASHVFGPHDDEQIMSVKMGFRYKIWD